MADLKTKKTKASVPAFLKGIENDQRRKDAQALLKIMKEVTGMKPAMWGPSIIGFGSYHYTYDSGREGDWPLTGFSPRKQNLVIYVMPGFSSYGKLLEKLGKHKTGKSCLYINKLDDIHVPTLKKLIKDGLKHMKKMYPS